MNKEEYIEDRKNSYVRHEAAYEMYMDKTNGANTISLTEFMSMFPLWMRMTGSGCEKYFEYWDKRFEL